MHVFQGLDGIVIMELFKRGDIIGKFEFVREVESVRRGKNIIRRAWFICPLCENGVLRPIRDIRHNNVRSCGCYNSKISKERQLKHGLRKHHLYTTWKSMKQRCFNSNNSAYVYYGGRGITVCGEWEEFKPFYDYVTNLINYNKEGYSLDRIDNDGNYEPGNVRWADWHTQSINTRVSKNNTSGYVGVSVLVDGFVASITCNHKHVYLGKFKTKEEAALSRDQYILENNLIEYKLQIINHY